MPSENPSASSGDPGLHAGLARSILAWIRRHELLRPGRAEAIAPLIASFARRCSPPARDHQAIDLRGYEFAAMFLALFWCFDHPEAQHEAGRDVLGRIRRSLDATPVGREDEDHPWLLAVAELLDIVTGPDAREVQVFADAFADHLDAVEEKLAGRVTTNAGAGATDLCARIDEFLRLRALLVATEPYLRGWQTMLALWPGPSFSEAVASLAAGVRRAHPHALLDRALDRARLAHARAPTERRRSPALSEIEALTVVLTYLPNDLGSVDRDRGAGGPEQEPNLVLHLERYFLARAQGHTRSCPWDEYGCALPAVQQAVTTTVDMYNAGIARFQALQQRAYEHEARYLSLLGRIVDGNLQSHIEHAGGQPRARAGSASASEPAPVGQATEPRYGAVETLMRLRFIDR